MNKKVLIIAGCVVLALCACVIVGVVVVLPMLTKTGIDTVQSSLKDNQRKDFLNEVNLDVNAAYSDIGQFPIVEVTETSKYTVLINGDVLENVQDTTVDLAKDFCYAKTNNQYSLKMRLNTGEILSKGNSETLCNL